MPEINLNGTKLNYTIKHSNRRKTIQLKILDATHLEITVPPGCSKQYIEELIRQKETWILKQTQRRLQLETIPINKSLEHGALVLFLGTPRKIIDKVTIAAPKVELTDNELYVYLKQGMAADGRAQLLYHWYVDQAAKFLTDKTGFWAKKIGCQPSRITIRDQKTRWGSCSSQRSLSYNWRIIMAPPSVIDYLVIHELCHILIPNHSAAFWKKVGTYLPDYAREREWLKNNGHLLKQIL